jgi:hypothetical protein
MYRFPFETDVSMYADIRVTQNLVYIVRSMIICVLAMYKKVLVKWLAICVYLCRFYVVHSI